MHSKKAIALLLLAPAAILPLSCSGSDGGSSTSTGTVSGNVLNPPNPVSGVTITATGPGGSFTTTTSNTGAFSIENVPAGNYTVAFDGSGVFDSSGNAIPDKVDLEFTDFRVGSGSNVVGGKPVFLPEESIGSFIDTSGSNTAIIPAGTLIENADLGISIVFEANTTVTFPNADNTTISITQVPLEHVPMALPSTVSTELIVTIQPPGATFDVRPKVIFPNANGLPAGTAGVSLYRFDHDEADWIEFGTGTVSADGLTVISDPGQGLEETGWHGPIVDTFCTTTVSGSILDGSSNGIADVVVTTVNGVTGTTDINGDYTLTDVPLPSGTFDVVVTALPSNNGGYNPNDSTSVVGVCAGTTNVPNIVLAAQVIDMTAPTVASTTPADLGTGIGDNAVITVTFSEVMSPGSLNTSNITVTSDGVAIPGVIGVSTPATQSIATFLPTALLPLDSAIEITIGTGVQDASGNSLDEDFDFSFATLVTSTGGATTIDATPDAPAGLDPGQTLQFSASVLDAASNAVAGPLVSWISDDPNIAAVDSTGRVTALLPGTTNITSSFGGATDTVSVTVNTPAVDSVTVTPTSQTMVEGGVQQFDAEALDAGTNALTGLNFNWTSTDNLVATVDASGTVTAIGAGTTTIRATEPASTLFGNATVTVVSPVTVDSVVVTPNPAMIEEGSSSQFTAEAFDSGMNLLPGINFIWTSSATNIAPVNSSGLVSGTMAGMATISARAEETTVEGSSNVTVFLNTELVITLRGGDQEADPLPGVRVLRNNPSTGAFIDEQTTDSAGTANFGMVGTSRTTVTVFMDDLANGSEAELMTFHNIEVGTYTFTLGVCDDAADFDVQVTGVPVGSDIARVHSAGYLEGDDFVNFGSSPSITVFGVEACELDASGNVSYVVTTESSSTGVPSAAAFLLDQDPSVLDGTTVPALVSPTNITSIPYTASAAARPTGGFVQRNGVQFDQFLGQELLPATSGNAYLAIPSGTDRMSFIFEQDNGPVNLGRELFFDTAPTSLSPSIPVVDVTSLARNSGTGEITWTVSGANASDIDFSSLEICYEDASQNEICWSALVDKSVTSFTPPALPLDLTLLGVPASGVSFEVDMTSLDAVMDLDSLISGSQAYGGNFDKFVLGAVDESFFLTRGEAAVTFDIGGAATGVVTVNDGSGAVVVTDGQSMNFPIGTSLTVTATADFLAQVTDLTCLGGTAAGLPTMSANCNFTLFDTDFEFVFVSFD